MRNEYVYRLVIDKEPDVKPGPSWDRDRWSRRRRYLTYTAAQRHLARVLDMGAHAHLERSQPITWTDPYPHYAYDQPGGVVDS